MKKTDLILTLFLLILFIPLSDAQQREIKPVNFEQISERLYQIPGGRGAHGGMYIGDNGVLLIDAKMDENSVNAVINKISEITDKPIKYLVNTHSDGDHVRGNQFFPKKTQEKVKFLIEKKYPLEDIKKGFEKNEYRLVEAIYNELK